MKSADLILFAAGLALLAFLAKRQAGLPPPVPPIRAQGAHPFWWADDQGL